MTTSSKTAQSKVAFVTGAGQGIGQAIAERLHRDGFRVAIADLNVETAEAVAASLGGPSAGALAVPVDVADQDSVIRAVDQAIEVFGDLHVMVNNAGIVPMTPLLDVTSSEFHRTMGVNAGGVLWGIQAAARAFQRLGHGGKIMNATSQAGHTGNPGLSVYSSTKFAVRGLTQSAARELAPLGITVNAWAPGAVRTAMMDPILEADAAAAGQSIEWAAEERGKSITIGRLSLPEDVANVVSFLAGSDSDYITGQSIVVDGGMVFN